MKCTKCGSIIEEQARFCGHCGEEQITRDEKMEKQNTEEKIEKVNNEEIAKECCVCKKAVAEGKRTYAIIPNEEQYIVCEDCFSRMCYLKQHGGQYKDAISEKAYEFLNTKKTEGLEPAVDEKISQVLETYLDENKNEENEKYKEQIKNGQQSLNGNSYEHDVFISTTPYIAGFDMEETIGVVFGETFFSADVLRTFISNMNNPRDNTAGTFTSSSVFEDARKYAIQKMKETTKNMGGNAIVSVTTNTSYGFDKVIQITMSGTAVKVIKRD